MGERVYLNVGMGAPGVEKNPFAGTKTQSCPKKSGATPAKGDTVECNVSRCIYSVSTDDDGTVRQLGDCKKEELPTIPNLAATQILGEVAVAHRSEATGSPLHNLPVPEVVILHEQVVTS